MMYVAINTNTKTKQAKKLVAFIGTFPFVRMLDDPNAITKKAIEAGRKGKTRKAKSVEQLFTNLIK